MSYDQLQKYRKNLRAEQAAVLAEVALRHQVRDVETGNTEPPLIPWYEYDDEEEIEAS
jgi:hypothetical protein